MDESTRCPRVLIVEDDALVAIDLASVLKRDGYEVVGSPGSVTAALTIVRKEKFDIALLDVNLNGETIEPIAEALTNRAIPFGIVTAYPSHILPGSVRGRPCISKPFRATEIMKLAAQLAGLANCTPKTRKNQDS